MRLALRFSRLGPVGDEFLKFRGEFLHKGIETARGGRAEKQPATALPFDLVGRFGVEMGVGGSVSGQGIEIVADGFGAKILLSYVPRQAGTMLETQPMLDSQKCFVDPPAAVIQGSKRGSGEEDGVEERSHHDMNPAIWRHHPDQTNGGVKQRAFVVLSVARIWGAQCHHPLPLDKMLTGFGTDYRMTVC